MKRIKFDAEDIYRGFETIVRSGTVVWTDDPEVYLVDEDCVKALEEKGIPYEMVKSQGKKEAKR